MLLSISDLDEIDKISEIEGVEMMRVSKVIFDPEPTQEARFLDVDGERAPYSDSSKKYLVWIRDSIFTTHNMKASVMKSFDKKYFEPF